MRKSSPCKMLQIMRTSHTFMLGMTNINQGRKFVAEIILVKSLEKNFNYLPFEKFT